MLFLIFMKVISAQNITKMQDCFVIKSAHGGRCFRTVTCLSQVISVCCRSHTLHCRVPNLMYLNEEKGSLGLQSQSVHTFSFSLSFYFFSK